MLSYSLGHFFLFCWLSCEPPNAPMPLNLRSRGLLSETCIVMKQHPRATTLCVFFRFADFSFPASFHWNERRWTFLFFSYNDVPQHPTATRLSDRTSWGAGLMSSAADAVIGITDTFVGPSLKISMHLYTLHCVKSVYIVRANCSINIATRQHRQTKRIGERCYSFAHTTSGATIVSRAGVTNWTQLTKHA